MNHYLTKKDLENFDKWSDEEITKFLIWDNVNALKFFGLKDIEERYFNGLKFAAGRYDKHKKFLDFTDSVLNKLFSIVKKKKKTVLLQDNRYPLITSVIKNNYNLKFIVSGKKERLSALQNFSGYLSINCLHGFIYKYWSKNDFKYLQELLKILENKIKKLDPDCIILYGDDKPIERSILMVSKKLGIPAINIQSVLLIEKFPLFFGALTDYIFVWGEYFKNIFIRHLQSKRDAKDIYILGYPSIIKNKPPESIRKIRTVYYLGENYENYNKEFLGIKMQTIENLNKICQSLKLNFFYRPHPGDDRELLKNNLLDVSFTSRDEKLTDSFNKGDVFISFDSTALAEASVYNKICLQLMNYPIKTDDLEKGGARIKSFRTIGELESYLGQITMNPKKIQDFFLLNNNYFIATPSNPEKRFLELLKKIDNKNE